MAAAPVVIAAMEPAQSALTSRKSWPKIRCCSPSQDLEAVEGKERQNRANITNSVCYHLSFNPPTPAFAKAGAAPGTTAGVEPVFVGLPLPCLRQLRQGTKGTVTACRSHIARRVKRYNARQASNP